MSLMFSMASLVLKNILIIYLSVWGKNQDSPVSSKNVLVAVQGPLEPDCRWEARIGNWMPENLFERWSQGGHANYSCETPFWFQVCCVFLVVILFVCSFLTMRPWANPYILLFFFLKSVKWQIWNVESPGSLEDLKFVVSKRKPHFLILHSTGFLAKGRIYHKASYFLWKSSVEHSEAMEVVYILHN